MEENKKIIVNNRAMGYKPLLISAIIKSSACCLVVSYYDSDDLLSVNLFRNSEIFLIYCGESEILALH